MRKGACSQLRMKEQMSTRFTRRELYDLVWSKPMIHLAKEIGVSDVALHKTCRRQNIPNPPLGWWAKKAAGKPVTQIPLPETENDDRVTITVRSASEANWKTNALNLANEKARLEAELPTSTRKQACKVFRATLAALRRGKPNDQGLVCIREDGLIPCRISKKSISRAAEFLPKLETAARVQGFALTKDGGPSCFSDGTQTVKFELTEGYTRRKHELTKNEQAKQAAWQKRLERSDWRYAHNDPFPTFADWDYTLTGKLSISLEPSRYYRHASPRRSFNDGKRQRLENIVDKIAVGIAVVASAKNERKRENDERAREHELQRELIEREARQSFIEKRRLNECTELLHAYQRLSQMESLLERIDRTALGSHECRVKEFISWLRSHINETYALFTTERLEAHFSEIVLFGPDDDRLFPSENRQSQAGRGIADCRLRSQSFA